MARMSGPPPKGGKDGGTAGPEGNRGRGDRRGGPPRERESRSKLYAEEVVHINRCAKVTSGGKRFSFSAFIVLGDSKGKVGYGMGKAKDLKPMEQAKLIGETVAALAVKAGITAVVLDRNGRRYGGRIAALADAARSKGLQF